MMMLRMILIGMLIIAGCNEKNDNKAQDKKELAIYNERVDERPGIKGIYIGQTLTEIKDQVKRRYPGTSHLDISKSALIKIDLTETFSLRDSLLNLGVFKIDEFYGQAYQDTIVNLRATFNQPEAVTSVYDILIGIYSTPSDLKALPNTYIYEGKNHRIVYSSIGDNGVLEFIDKDFMDRIATTRRDTISNKSIRKAINDF